MPTNNFFNPYVGLEFERNISFESGEYYFAPEVIEKFWGSFNGKLKVDPVSKKPIGTEFSHPKTGTEYILVNDTGYSEIEFPTTVYKDLNQHLQDFNDVFDLAASNLKQVSNIKSLRFLGTGSHPVLDPSFENYFKYRTPKGDLYSIICEGSQFVKGRNWNHNEYISLTSDQINIDLPEGHEFELVQAFNRLMGVFVAMSANSAFVNGKPSKYKSIRQLKQYEIVANPTYQIEKEMVGMPIEEFQSFDQMFDLIFNTRPILFVGSGKESKLAVPLKSDSNPPTLVELIEQTTPWETISLTGEQSEYTSNIVDIQSPLHRISFWNIKPQLNFSDSQEITTAEFVQAAKEKRIETFLKSKNVKTFVEIRTIDSALPGLEMCMPALIKGLTVNYTETIDYVKNNFSNYNSARELYFKAAEHGLDTTHNDIPLNQFGLELVDIARNGLQKLNQNEEKFLDKLEQNLKDNICPSDILIDAYNKNGINEVIKLISLTQ